MFDINIYYVDMLAFCCISSIWFAFSFWVLPLFSWFYVNSKHALRCRHTDSFSSPAVQLLVIYTVHLMPVRNKLTGCSPAVFARLFWLPIQQDYTRVNKNADNWCLHAQHFVRSRSWTTGMKQGEGFYWWIASRGQWIFMKIKHSGCTVTIEAATLLSLRCLVTTKKADVVLGMILKQLFILTICLEKDDVSSGICYF